MTGPTPASPIGRMINGRYEIIAVLGSGAFGEVYEVHDHHTGQDSALKIMRSIVSGPWEESHVLAGLHGEYILPIRNADVAAGAPFIVTEVARGGSVQTALASGLGLPVDQAVRWIRQASRGVARIHDANLLHNDIKPENLFLDDHGDVLVGDLGLCSLRDTQGSGHFGGTPSTMAPEVAQVGASVPQAQWSLHRPTSIASDVYSLGATLYWFLAGQPPYDDPRGGMAIMTAVAAASPPALADVAPHVPSGVVNVVRTAMARDPKDRYDTAAAFDAALGRLTTQRRNWIRIHPHPAHAQCFLGVGVGADLHVCAVPTGVRMRHEIQVRRVGTGHRVGLPWRSASGRDLPRACRAVFRQHQ